MIKKTFHYLFFILFGILWSGVLGLIYQQIFRFIYHVDVLSPVFYYRIAEFWNNGGIISSKDFTMLLLLFSYVPVFGYGLYKLYHFKFMNLVLIPLNGIANLGMKKYQKGAPTINIKNLKVEEKKTLEQIVQERIEAETKKNPQQDTAAFRQKIIEKITEEVK